MLFWIWWFDHNQHIKHTPALHTQWLYFTEKKNWTSNKRCKPPVTFGKAIRSYARKKNIILAQLWETETKIIYIKLACLQTFVYDLTALACFALLCVSNTFEKYSNAMNVCAQRFSIAINFWVKSNRTTFNYRFGL